jgi:pimeloyl-ACP methyl ester carboxylesterase
VRDIVTMADELYGSDKDINFYGISYGTYMGYMLTQMFPNRMGKVILDGVMNPQATSQYFPVLGGDEQIGDAPEVLKGFYNTCALAGASKCPLARAYPTPDAIKGAINTYLETAFKTWNSGGGGASYNMLIAQILFPVLYLPEQWPLAAIALSVGLSGNKSVSESVAMMKGALDERRGAWPYLPNVGSSSWGEFTFRKRQVDQDYVGYSWDSNYTIVNIQCADTPEVQPDIVTTPRVFEETIRIARSVWPLAAGIVSAEHFCHRYTPRAVERYSGPWDVAPKNVVLVIGNQADPVTPFRNSQLVTRLLGGKGRLVQQAGYGHTSRECGSLS